MLTAHTVANTTSSLAVMRSDSSQAVGLVAVCRVIDDPVRIPASRFSKTLRSIGKDVNERESVPPERGAVSQRDRRRWRSTAEVALLLGITEATVAARVKAGTLKARTRHGSTLVRVPDDVIDVEGTLTRAEVAAMLAVHPNRVAALVSRGTLPARRLGNRLVFRLEDVDAFIEASRVAPGSLPWAHQQRDPVTGRWR